MTTTIAGESKERNRRGVNKSDAVIVVPRTGNSLLSLGLIAVVRHTQDCLLLFVAARDDRAVAKAGEETEEH